MPITKTEINSVEAKRGGSPGKKVNLRIDNNSSVTLISLVTPEEARIDFRYQATYQGLGNVAIEGKLTFTGEAKSLYESWSETGNMPEDVASEIHSSIMRACIPVAVLLSREVRLPPPLPLPNIQVKGKGAKKRPRPEGIEVA